MYFLSGDIISGQKVETGSGQKMKNRDFDDLIVFQRLTNNPKKLIPYHLFKNMAKLEFVMREIHPENGR